MMETEESPRVRVSDDAVKKATGKTWDEWIARLDRLGAEKMTHSQIARMLHDGKHIQSDWWCQMVTVGYEYAKRRRTVGQTEEAGFDIGVQKTIDAPPMEVWKMLFSPKGLAAWLGKAKSIPLEAGSEYKTQDGTSGQIRTLHAASKIRLTWKPKTWKNSSTLQIYVLPSGKKTSLRFHQEKLTDSKTREAMRKRWTRALEKLERMAKK